MVLGLRMLAQRSTMGLTARQSVRCTPPLKAVVLPYRKSCVAQYSSEPSAPDTLENVVHLDCEGRVEKLTLVNRRIQLRAVKEAFGLSSVRINGRLEPTDDEGYTITKFNPQTTLAISGQPSTEMSTLFGEMASLRADISKLIEMRGSLKDSGSLAHDLKAIKEDLTATKRLVAEIVAVGATCHEPEKGPDFTKTSQDGYTFDTWWEAQTLARNIISGHTQVKPGSGSTDIIHDEDHVVASGLHTT
ncbi:hypothetical protein OEZ86_000289 [Tetradesmus obliquus]|nr:hypothetical protein OEZ86_000289 [Tetradesmus obliquus]